MKCSFFSRLISQASCYNTYNHTCAVLEREPNIFQQLSMDDDMRLVMYKGEGSQLNFQMACPLGRSMLSGLLSSLLSHLPEGEKKEEREGEKKKKKEWKPVNLASPAVTRARPAAAAPKCKSIKEIQEEELEKKRAKAKEAEFNTSGGWAR